MIPKYLQSIFWDINLNNFNPVAYPNYTISRVLEHGDREAVAWMEQAFSGEQITAVIRTDRGLSRKSANFWALVYHVPTEEVAALRGTA